MLTLSKTKSPCFIFAWHADERVALLGAMQSLFEASMYTFVFLWTPALSSHGAKLPHGLVFAIFMTASMVGTAAAEQLMKLTRIEVYMQGVFWLSAVALFVPVLYHTEMQERADTESKMCVSLVYIVVVHGQLDDVVSPPCHISMHEGFWFRP